jgi:hypothetical protein
VFVSGTKSECRKLLQTILKNRRLCSLLAPFFTPNAAPAEFIQLYERVVTCLREDNSDVIFMLLTKVLAHGRLGSVRNGCRLLGHRATEIGHESRTYCMTLPASPLREGHGCTV